MERKKLWKRGLSLGLAFVMALSVGIDPLPDGFITMTAKAAEKTFELPKSELALGAPVVPKALEADNGFKDSYIRGGAMSLNNYFRVTSESNSNQSNGNTLTRRKIMHDDTGAGWNTVYRWNCTDAQMGLLGDSAYTLKYEGNAISEKHTRTYWEGWNCYRHKNGWDWVNLEIKDGVRTLWGGQSYLQDSGKGQYVSWSRDSLWPTDNYIEYIAKSYNCKCGESGVSGSTFWLVDNTIPAITNTYICSNPADPTNTKITSGVAVSEAITSYIVFEFSEKVRFSDNKGSELTLDLDVYDKNTGTNLDKGIIQGKLYSFDGNRMIFAYTVNETINGKATDIQLRGISSQQSSFVNKSFKLNLYDGDGNVANTGSQASSCYITDIAGNALDWSNSNRNIRSITYDNIAPELNKVTMNGNFITTESLKTTNALSDGVDRTAVFAGNGDWVQFELHFSENINVITTADMQVVLNVRDINGDYIKLSANQNGNRIVTDKLTITEDTFYAADMGKRIYVTGVNNVSKVTDVYGNTMTKGSNYTANLSAVSIMPAQGIFIDTDAPIITTTLIADDGIYTPVIPAELNSGEYFTFPIVINEDVTNTDLFNTSYVEGQKLGIGMVRSNEMNFEWYISGIQEIDTSKFCAAQTVPTEETTYYFDQIEGQIVYLHVKVDKKTDYNYVTKNDLNGVFLEADIYIVSKDNAGNETTATFPIIHQLDYTMPGGSIATAYKHSVDYDNLTSRITTNIEVWDDFGIKDVSYYWTYTTTDEDGTEQTQTTERVTIDLSSSFTKNYTQEVSLDIPFEIEGDAGRRGSAYLTLSYNDFAGYSGSKSGNDVGAETDATENSVYNFNFTKSKAVYDVVTGTKTEPILAPQVYLSAPVSEATDSGASAARTVVFIPYGTDETTGETKYFVFDPYKGDGSLGYPVDLDLIGDLLTNQGAYVAKDYGYWHTAVGTIADGAGDFSSCEYIIHTDDVNNYQEFIDLINHTYGSFEIIFVTSSCFIDGIRDDYVGANGKDLEFTEAESTVESVRVYLANNATYEATITGVKDTTSEDALSKLNYVPGNVPAQSLDNVAISLELKNTTAAEAVAGYGLIPLDFANSQIDLVYYEEDTSYGGTVIHTWPLANAKNQTVVIPENVATETGWYGLVVTITNMNGTATTTKMEQFYFMDNRELDISLDAYYKAYDHEDAYLLPKAIDETAADWTDGSAIEVALGTAPEGWTLDTYFKFSKGKSISTEHFGIQELVKLRVYNKNDADYENNAIWMDANDIETIKYTPVYAETITAESYGTADNLLLPLYDGNNLICYELVNTNGVVKHHEVSVFAYAKCEDWELDVQYTQVSDRTGGIMEVTVNPSVSENIDLANSTFAYVDLRSGYTEDTYVFRDDFDYEFWLLDQNGNLSTRRYAVADVDGIAPTVYTSSAEQEEYYNFIVYAQEEEGTLNADELTVTFDADYSAVLMGLTGEERINNTEQITIKVPINREKDENGNYLPWESFEPGNYGIYRTQLLHEGPYVEEYYGNEYEGYISVEIWGAWKFDKEFYEARNSGNPELYEKYVNAYNRSFTFSIPDANGNIGTGYKDIADDDYGAMYNNSEYHIELAGFNENGEMISEHPYLNKNGEIGVYSTVPLSKIYSYGATKLREVQTAWPGNIWYYSTLPMILQDGEYNIEFMDLFGDIYEQKLTISEFGTIGIDVQFSETEYTNQDVTVSANANLTNDFIKSIKAETESGKKIDVTIDASDATNATNASIVMPENGKVTIVTDLGEERIVTVNNIDKVLEPASVIFLDSYVEELDGTEDTLDEEVTAYVVCDEDIEGVECELRYVFPRGSKKGDTHTFTYRDKAGNEGTITATLPCDISEIPREEDWVDTTAPMINTMIYGMRNNKYQLVTEIKDPHHMYVEEGQTAYDYDDFVTMLTSKEAGMGSYVARGYKLILSIEDESETKVLVQAAGKEAPTSYTAVTSGSSVAEVEVNKNTITISENVVFDLYIIDAADNVTAVTGIEVTTIDKEAPAYGVVYEVLKDNEGNTYVHAVFEPERTEDELEEIYPLDSSMLYFEKQVGLQESDSEDEPDTPIYRPRYYFVFTENGTETFRYVDMHGNEGMSEATVAGFATAPPQVMSVEWLGTVANAEPAESTPVNNDVVAKITASKTISDAILYTYDADATNGMGEKLSEDAKASVSFSGTTVYVTYEENMESVVVELVAKEDGKRVYEILPSVGCIDKTAPVITVESAELSSDKRFMTITLKADEAAAMSEFQETAQGFGNYEHEFKTTHTWIAKDAKERMLHFTDKAGNRAEYKLTENSTVDIVLLEAVFSVADTHEDATGNPSKDFLLEAGGAIWVKTNKAAEVYFVEEEKVNVPADTWTKIVLPDLAGVNFITLIDSNTGIDMQKAIAVQPKDAIAPQITFETSSVVINENATITEMLQAIRNGVTIVDNKDSEISSYEVTGKPEAVTPGLYELTYSATDSSGNVGKAYRNLYIMEEDAAVLYVNGMPALPYGRTFVDTKELKFSVEGFEELDLLTIKIRDGFRSVGQMKHSTTTVENLETTVSKNGFYTVYIRTQDRAEYITYLYVEE